MKNNTKELIKNIFYLICVLLFLIKAIDKKTGKVYWRWQKLHISKQIQRNK